MANFKRRRPKNARAGCLLCHPHKANGAPPAWQYTVAELAGLAVAGGASRATTSSGQSGRRAVFGVNS